LLQDFQNWIAQPFSPSMDAWHWFLFFGLLIAISVLWSFILYTLRGTAAFA